MSNILKTLPVTNLLFSPAKNVRKTRSSDEEDQTLIASIRANGLINNLVVTPNADVPNHYDVIAGGRRILALEKLIAEGHLPEDHAVPCQIVSDNIEEISLSENIVRSDMHPLDEFEAFADLHDQGMSVTDVAMRFGASEHHVHQRLRIGRVAEPIRQAVRDGDLSIHQLIAYARTDDHAKQMSIFNDNPDHASHYIQRCIKDGTVYSDEKLVAFIGMEAYTEAGGTFSADLFSEGDGRYILDDPMLVERLAQKKLQVAAEGLINAGWKWAEPMIEFYWYDLSKDYPERLYAHGDEHTQDQKAESGCIITIDYHGKLKIEQGLQRKCDVTSAKPEPSEQGISQSLKEFLANQKLAILMKACSHNTDIAFDLMLYQMLAQHADRYTSSIVGISPQQGIGHSARNEVIDGLLPTIEGLIDLEALMGSQNPLVFLRDVDKPTKSKLFTICMSLLIQNGYNDTSAAVNDYLAERTEIDMQKAWRPTKDNYWIKLKKAHILKIAAEVLGDEWAKANSEQKKADLADLMGQIFAGRSVLGVRSDQSARALAWIPQEMVFGEIPEMPPLRTNEADSTDNLTVEESKAPVEPSEPSSPVEENPIVTALRDKVKQDFGDDPRIMIIDGSCKKPQPAPTEPKQEKPQFIVTKHRLHFDENGVHGIEIPLDEEGDELPAAFL